MADKIRNRRIPLPLVRKSYFTNHSPPGYNKLCGWRPEAEVNFVRLRQWKSTTKLLIFLRPAGGQIQINDWEPQGKNCPKENLIIDLKAIACLRGLRGWTWPQRPGMVFKAEADVKVVTSLTGHKCTQRLASVVQAGLRGLWPQRLRLASEAEASLSG